MLVILIKHNIEPYGEEFPKNYTFSTIMIYSTKLCLYKSAVTAHIKVEIWNG